MDDLLRILSFQAGYNTSVVLLGVTLLGAGGGVVGAVVLMRRVSLMSDSISHSTLPGVAIGYLTALALGGTGRELPVIILGAALTAALGVLAVHWIREHTRLPEDSAIGTVLSVFYGLGIVLFSFIQSLDTGSQAGVNGFLLGAAAALSLEEALLIGGGSLLVCLAVAAMFKEFRMLCFDRDFAEASGFPVRRLDLILMALLLAIVVIGLKTVGMVLIIAIVIIPGVAARFWSDRFLTMTIVAGVLGGASAYLGAALSALYPATPAGAVIVLCAAAMMILSLLIAPARGILPSLLRRIGFALWLRERRGLILVEDGRAIDAGTALLLFLFGHRRRDGSLSERGRAAVLKAREDIARLEEGLHANRPAVPSRQTAVSTTSSPVNSSGGGA